MGAIIAFLAPGMHSLHGFELAHSIYWLKGLNFKFRVSSKLNPLYLNVM